MFKAKLIEWVGPKRSSVGHASSEPVTSASCSILCIDQSGSMSISDYTPSRLEGAISACQTFITEKRTHQPNAHIAIVGFDTSGIVHCPVQPIAHDFSSYFKKMKSGGGTNFHAGLKTVQEVFAKGNKKNNLQPHLVFLSDGHSGGGYQSIKLSRKLKNQGFEIDCIGVGGSPSDVDEKLLKKIASKALGKPRYRFISDTQALQVEFKKLARLTMVPVQN